MFGVHHKLNYHPQNRNRLHAHIVLDHLWRSLGPRLKSLHALLVVVQILFLQLSNRQHPLLHNHHHRQQLLKYLLHLPRYQKPL